MRDKYPIALVGCAAHVMVLIAAMSAYALHQTFMPGRGVESFPDGFTLAVLLLAWPLWGVYLWGCSKKEKFSGVVVPMLLGAIALFPFLLRTLGAWIGPGLKM